MGDLLLTVDGKTDQGGPYKIKESTYDQTLYIISSTICYLVVGKVFFVY